MKILHFSDTHLGFQAFDRVNAAGVNTREQDVYDAFERVIDRALEERPDLIVHSGDFFHRPSPSNRALTFGLEQLTRLSRANLPIVIIAGNHETPKTVYNSPILRALNTIEGVFPIFNDEYESFEFGQVVVHGVPHINDNRILLETLDMLTPVPGKFNILMLHTSLGKRYLMEEYGEQIFPPEFEIKLNDFQYVALGHWHDYQAVKIHENAWYSGSTERFSDTEIGSEKGVIWLEIQPDGQHTTTFEVMPSRPWLRWECADCQALSTAELEADLQQFAVDNEVKDAMISLSFYNIRPEQTLELNNARLRQIFPDALQLIPKRRTVMDGSFAQNVEVEQFDRLDNIFADYIRSKYPDDAALADRLAIKARRYFGDGES